MKAGNEYMVYRGQDAGVVRETKQCEYPFRTRVRGPHSIVNTTRQRAFPLSIRS